MIAAIYARKSNDQNLPDVEKSVTRQVGRGTAYAQSKSWTVDPAHVYVDDAISDAEFVRRGRAGAARREARPGSDPPRGARTRADDARRG